MRNKQYRISVYRALRKLGVQKEDITVEKDFKRDLGFDATDWLCFLFLVETRSNQEFDDREIESAHTIGEFIEIMEQTHHSVTLELI